MKIIFRCSPTTEEHISKAHILFGLTYHTAAGVAGVLQVVVQQLGGSILESFGQSPQQHCELWSVELKQGNQHHLGRLQVQDSGEDGGYSSTKKADEFPGSRSTLTELDFKLYFTRLN